MCLLGGPCLSEYRCLQSEEKGMRPPGAGIAVREWPSMTAGN